ncbi:hypothetical protein HUB94_30855 (plasmid) [Paenibacillus cellulosilyticus]|nr:hypothetical protein HUB94_30855 [Paenibacillus cellulosilyticus]
MAENNDLFGTVFKAETIRSILDNSTEYFEENNMIALYGNWGSGKTSVMKYIESKTTRYKTVFFEAWKYEHDSNLALSLFEQIVAIIEDENEMSSPIIESIKVLGRSIFNFGKKLLHNSEISLYGITVATGLTENDIVSIGNRSFYAEVIEFNKKFKMLIEDYYQHTSRKILIFVDDLDRCESENILNLLSSIKHFFTDSNKIVYFCGIDKDAVNKAINIKYNNIIKSEEYLEKIFDLTFNMPEIISVDEFINDFFRKLNIQNNSERYSRELLQDFFRRMNFTNPRKVKKVLNKYIYLNDLFKSGLGVERHFPESFENHSPMQMVMIMFVIILYEFNRKLFDGIYDIESKFAQIINNHKAEQVYTEQSRSESLSSFINRYRASYKYLNINFGMSDSVIIEKRRNDIVMLIMSILPTDINNISVPALGSNNSNEVNTNITNYISQFRMTENKILYLFALQFFDLVSDINKKKYTDHSGNIGFYSLFQMANLYF